MALRIRLTRIVSVLREAQPFGLLLVGTLGPIGLSMMFASDFVNRARHAGLAWEILGVVVVAIGIAETRMHFGRPGFTRSTIAWFVKLGAALRGQTPKTIQLEGGGYVTIGGSAKLTVGRNPNRPVEERLALLEKEIDSLRNDLQTRDERLAHDIRAVSQRVTDEEHRHDAALVEIKRGIEEVMAGGLTLEAIGLFWLIMGLVSASLPEELSRLWAFLVMISALAVDANAWLLWRAR